MTASARSIPMPWDSTRHLDWAPWRTVYNAVILPISISTYAAAVGYAGQASLLQDLCTAPKHGGCIPHDTGRHALLVHRPPPQHDYYY